jgi:hypothetical protein
MSTTLAHSGLPSGTTRFDLLRLFEQVARPGFGLSSTAVALVRQYILKTMDADTTRAASARCGPRLAVLPRLSG